MTIVGDRYSLGRRRRTRDRGETYDGTDRLLGRPVAVLLGDDEPGTGGLGVELVAGVPAQLDAGTADLAGRRVSWIVTEAETGLPIADLAPGALDPWSRLRVARELTAILVAVHRRGRAHGEVRPEAVLLQPDGRVQLAAATGRGAVARDDIRGVGAVLARLAGPDPDPAGVRLLEPDDAVDPDDELRRLAREATSERTAIRPFSMEMLAERIRAVDRAARIDRMAPGEGHVVLAEARRLELPPDAVALIAALAARLPPAALRRVPGWAPFADRYGIRRAGPERRRTAPRRHRVVRRRPLVRRRGRRIGAIAAGLAAIAVVAAVGVGASAHPTAVREVAAPRIPDVVGLSSAAAAEQVRAAGFAEGGTRARHSPTIAKGTVIETTPAAGARPGAAAPVVLVVSSGPLPLRVDDLVRGDLATALRRVAAAGFVLGTLTLQAADAPFGRVLSATTEGAPLRGATAVDLVVTSGRQTVPPELIGQDEAGAAANLTAAGFTVAVERVATEDSPDGIVLGARPAAGSPAPPGSTVTLRVAQLDPDGPLD